MKITCAVGTTYFLWASFAMLGQDKTIPVSQTVSISLQRKDITLQARETDGSSTTLLLAYSDGRESDIIIYNDSLEEVSRFSVPYIVTRAALGKTIVLAQRLKTMEPSFEVCRYRQDGAPIGKCLHGNGWLERLYFSDEATFGMITQRVADSFEYTVAALDLESGTITQKGSFHPPIDRRPYFTAGRQGRYATADVTRGNIEICNTDSPCQSKAFLTPDQKEQLKTRTAQEELYRARVGLYREVLLIKDLIWTVRGTFNVYSGFVVDIFTESGEYIKSLTFEVPQFADLRTGQDHTGHLSVTAATVVGNNLIAFDRRCPNRLVVYRIQNLQGE